MTKPTAAAVSKPSAVAKKSESSDDSDDDSSSDEDNVNLLLGLNIFYSYSNFES